MKKFYLVSFLLFSIFSFTSFSQTNSQNGIQTNIINTTPTSTTVEFILNNYQERTIDINGTTTVLYSISGSNCLMEKGNPQLPIHRASIIIPDLVGMNYRIIAQDFNTIETLPVTPSKGHLTRNI